MWPGGPGYGPYSPSAMEAARRRTQELYNARRAQRGLIPAVPYPAPPLPQPPPPSVAGRELIWSRTSGRPQSGSYIISPVGGDQPSSAHPAPTSLHGTGFEEPATGAEMVFTAEEETAPQARPSDAHTMVVEAAVEPTQQFNAPNSPDTGGASVNHGRLSML